MRQPDVRKYLFDILEACDRLAEFTSGKSFTDYESDAMLRSAVERQFEIIGEALRLAVRVDSALTDRITDAARIIAFRNRLIHAYAAISNEVVWGVLETGLPRLRLEVAGLMEH